MSDTGGIVFAILIFAVIGAVLSARKNRSAVQGFIVGGLLNVVGIIIILCAKPGRAKPPEGLVAVKCPRCNTVQNAPKQQTEFECWQCHLVEPVSNAVVRS